MNIFAISDLHLPGSKNKRMDKFGDNWIDHDKKIQKNWKDKITKSDIVLVPGDLTWAMDWDGAEEDIQYLANLPGRKFIVKGNHDYFLSKNNKCKKKFEMLDTEESEIRFLYNSATIIETEKWGKVGLFGTRGWYKEADDDGNHSKKICDRELNRLDLSYQHLQQLQKLQRLEKLQKMEVTGTGERKEMEEMEKLEEMRDDLDITIAMFHYPLTNRFFDDKTKEKPSNKDSKYVELYDDRFLEYLVEKNVDIAVFGHVHQMKIENYKHIDGIDIYCCSADIIDFDPIRIL